MVEVSESEGVARIELQATVPVTCDPMYGNACGISIDFAHDPEPGGKHCVGK